VVGCLVRIPMEEFPAVYARSSMVLVKHFGDTAFSARMSAGQELP
jgi:hypothetical protein